MTAILQRFTQIRRDEVAPVLASALSFFFILTALMVLRPAREALGMRRGIETVRWLSGNHTSATHCGTGVPDDANERV